MKTIMETVQKPQRPVKVLQFGEGNFLRAFVDWIIDILNEKGGFNGSVMMVQPLANGMGDKINGQNGLYTTVLRGVQNGKPVEEFRKMLNDLNSRVNIVTPDTIPNFPELIEDGNSFEENAEKKAEQASAYADMAAFADDSGLMVEALDGAPGIFSARYAGDGATDAQRIAKLLDAMKGKTNRRAKFVCAIAIAYRGDDVALFRGEVCGTIADAPRGTNGFGYDRRPHRHGHSQRLGMRSWAGRTCSTSCSPDWDSPRSCSSLQTSARI